MPVLLLLATVALDFGRLFFSYVQVTNAAREATAYAAGNPTDLAGTQARGLQEVNVQGQGGEGRLTFATTCADQSGRPIDCSTSAAGGGTGNVVTVAATEQFAFLTPVIGSLFGGSLNLSASASSAVLELAASGGTAPTTCQVRPVPGFIVAVTGLTVSLDASASTPTGGQCAIASYNWEMGDGATLAIPVTGKTASYTYAGGGIYTIALTVGNPAGTTTTTQTLDIGVSPTPTPTPTPAPTPTPTPSPTATATPAPVCNYVPSITASERGNSGKYTFTGAYTGQPAPASWGWDFGDDQGSLLQNPPEHDYSGPGPWTVTLTIQGGSCSAQSATYVATK